MNEKNIDFDKVYHFNTTTFKLTLNNQNINTNTIFTNHNIYSYSKVGATE